MNISDWAFIGAGSIGSIVAVIHGLILQKSMIPTILETAKMNDSFRRLTAPLLHFSTIAWFLGGLALIAAPFYMDGSAKLTTAIFVGSFYTFGAVGNFWGTRGKHPGWMLLAAAVGLIVFGIIVLK